jgi:hypothetical protein
MPNYLTEIDSTPDCFEHVQADCFEHVQNGREVMQMFKDPLRMIKNHRD